MSSLPSPAVPTYIGPGFHFEYPQGWLVEETRTPEEFVVTVRPDAEATATWSATMLIDRPEVEDAVAAVLRAFEEEYDNLDSYPAESEIAGRKTVGIDIEFVCLELTISAFVRVLQTEEFTLVILYQAMDAELDDVTGAFEEINASLECSGLSISNES